MEGSRKRGFYLIHSAFNPLRLRLLFLGQGMSGLFNHLPLQVSLERQIKCLERELAYRRRVYPRWVSLGKYSQEHVDEEFAALEAAIQTIKELQK